MRKSLLFKSIIILATASASSANAATLQLLGGFENSKFLKGVNLTDDSPIASITADWTFEHGAFAGVDCYVSSVDVSRALDKGCDIYAGYFAPINANNAVSMQITRHEYSRGLGRGWDYTDFAVSWHPSKTSSLTATYSDNWLRRPFDTYTLKADTQFPITESLNLDLSASVTAIESGAPVNELYFAKASLSYIKERWTTEFGIIFADKDQRRMVPFDVDEAELQLSVSYRLY